MKCIECGHELKDGAVYCIRCGAMQISMDGTPLEAKQEWPEVEPQTGNSNWRPSVDQGGGGNNGRHTRDFTPAPDNNGRRIAAVVVGLVLAAAVIGGIAISVMGGQSSNSNDGNTTTTTTTTTTESSETASSETASSASTTSTTSSASSASATASSAAASSASAAASSAAAEPAPTIVNEPQQQPEPEPQPAQVSQVGDEPSYAPAPGGGDYVLGDSSSRYYSRAELEGMSTTDLYYARNEIFARHGRMFHRSDLQAYFNSKSWYTPIYTPEQWDSMGNQLSDVELQNSNLMKEVEAARGSAYL